MDGTPSGSKMNKQITRNDRFFKIVIESNRTTAEAAVFFISNMTPTLCNNFQIR